MRKCALMLLLVFFGEALGEGELRPVIETWLCSPGTYFSATNIVVTAKVLDGRKTGVIDVAGVTHEASFQVAGFNRRWNFGGATKDGLFSYAFLIWPSGDAGYFDFTLKTQGEAQQMFFCKQD